MSLSVRTSRIQADLRLPPAQNQISLECWRGDPFIVPCSVLDGGALAVMTNVASLTLLIKSTISATTSLMSKTVSSFTTDDGSGTGACCEFSFTETETNLAGATERRNEYWALLYAIDSPGSRPRKIAQGLLTMAYDGDPIAAGAAPSNPGIILNNRRGTIDLGSGVTSAAVTFGTALDAAPSQILLTMRMPSASGALIGASYHTKTASGFTLELTGPTPDADHKCDYLALE